MIPSICCLQDCTLRADSRPCICIYKRKPEQEVSWFRLPGRSTHFRHQLF